VAWSPGAVSPLVFVLATLGIAVLGGLLGSLVGLGGGIVVVPALTLGLGVDFHVAVGASLVAVIATSSGAAAAYTRDHLSNLRVAMFLEVATVAGAVTGALVAGLVATSVLHVVFGGVLVVAALGMVTRREDRASHPVASSELADRLQLHGEYPDPIAGRTVGYRVARPGLGFGLMYLAGITSGLLGIGGGTFKVPAMDLAMGLPLKVSTATSNLMIGVTAAGAALVYLGRGEVNPYVAAPVALGVVAGAALGARLMPRADPRRLRGLFVVVLVVTAGQMLVAA